MTVTALVTRNDITATASQTSFTYTFRVLAATDMDVYQNGVLLSSGYTVNDVGNTTGGTVVLDSGVPVGQIVSLVLAMPLDRTTNYQNSGKFLADDVNEDFDKIYIGAVQNENEGGRSLRLKDVEPPTAGVDMTIPLKADRLGKFLSFNATTGAPEVSSGTGANAYDSAAWSAYNFTGNGSTTAFVLGIVPHSENNTQVYIDGVYQQKDGYSLSGSTITFSVAPPNLSTIEVMVTASLAVGATSSDLVSYLPAGTGAVATTVQTKLRESVSVKDFGAVGDGVTDDTVAIQAALDASNNVNFGNSTYIFSELTFNANLNVHSNSATLKRLSTYTGSNDGITIGNNVILNGNLIVDGNGLTINSTSLVKVTGDDVTGDSIHVQNIGSLSVTQSRGITVEGDNFRFYSISGNSAGYSTLQLNLTKNIANFTVTNFTSSEHLYKGFVINNSFTVKQVYIGNFFSRYTGSTTGTDGLLTDTNVDNTVLNIERLVVDNLDIDGAEANCVKVENVKECVFGSAKLRNASNAYVSRNNLTMSARTFTCDTLDCDYSILMKSEMSNINSLNNLTANSNFPIEYADDNFTATYHHVLSSAYFPSLTSTIGFIRIDFDRTQPLHINIGMITTLNQRTLNLQGSPSNLLTRDCITIDRVAGYTGSAWSANATNDVTFVINGAPVQATSAELTAIGNVINTEQKFKGKGVFDSTVSKTVYATDVNANSVWFYADGTLAHTPV